MKPVFLFDMDGTLVDASQAIYDSAVFAAVSVDGELPTRNQVEGVIGLPLMEMFLSLRFPEDKVEMAVESYRAHYRKIGKDQTRLLPGAAEAVRLARSVGRTAVVTTKTGWHTRELVVHLGIGDLLETVIGFEDVSRPKPDGEPIWRALERLEIDPGSDDFDPANVWMIGDTVMDEGAARAAGVRCALVPGFGADLRRPKEHLSDNHHATGDSDVYRSNVGDREVLRADNIHDAILRILKENG